MEEEKDVDFDRIKQVPCFHCTERQATEQLFGCEKAEKRIANIRVTNCTT